MVGIAAVAIVDWEHVQEQGKYYRYGHYNNHGFLLCWWQGRDSNPRFPAYEAGEIATSLPCSLYYVTYPSQSCLDDWQGFSESYHENAQLLIITNPGTSVQSYIRVI